MVISIYWVHKNSNLLGTMCNFSSSFGKKLGRDHINLQKKKQKLNIPVNFEQKKYNQKRILVKLVK